jgi:hypothetical protein
MVWWISMPLFAYAVPHYLFPADTWQTLPAPPINLAPQTGISPIWNHEGLDFSQGITGKQISSNSTSIDMDSSNLYSSVYDTLFRNGQTTIGSTVKAPEPEPRTAAKGKLTDSPLLDSKRMKQKMDEVAEKIVYGNEPKKVEKKKEKDNKKEIGFNKYTAHSVDMVCLTIVALAALFIGYLLVCKLL